MSSRSSRGFTLIEMLMVMVIIAIIASLIVGVSGYANKRSAATRTMGEIQGLSVACESFKADNGTVPRDETKTEANTPPAPIDPRLHGDPNSKSYQDASQFLYQQLAGDADLDGRPGDTVNGVQLKMYTEFKPSRLGFNQNKTQVIYLQDPYGNSYGYSTAGARAEEQYRQKATARKTGEEEGRSSTLQGFNSTFDLWSTAGATKSPPDDATRMKWVKNW